MSLPLIERVLEGDAAAWDELVELLTPVFVAVARHELSRNLGGRVGVRDVDDLVHEVFLALISDRGRTLRRYDGRTDVRTLFKVYARSRIRDIARKENRRRALLGRRVDVDEAYDLETPTPRPDQIVEARELAASIRRGVSEAHRTPLARVMTELVLFEQASTDDVQAKTGKTRQQIFRWRSRIMQTARACCVEAEG